MENSWKAGRTLITGGAGFVGRWFAQRLVELGDEVVIVDNLAPTGGGLSPEEWKIQAVAASSPRLFFINDDCRNFFELDSGTWNRVLHLAAVVGGREVIERHPLAVAEDLAIDADFWRWIESNEPDEVFHFSSSAAYPVSLQSELSPPAPLGEEHISFGEVLGQPDLTYGWAKLTSEYLAEISAKSSKSKIVTFRPFSGYGEDQSLAYPFPSIIRRAVDFSRGEIPEMFVWGSGLQSRDFIHISDVVEMALQAHKLLDTGSAINLGSGKATTFLELAELALNELGITANIQSQIDMPQGVHSRFASTKNLDRLGIAPKMSLREGVRKAIEFHSN